MLRRSNGENHDNELRLECFGRPVNIYRRALLLRSALIVDDTIIDVARLYIYTRVYILTGRANILTCAPINAINAINAPTNAINAINAINVFICINVSLSVEIGLLVGDRSSS